MSMTVRQMQTRAKSHGLKGYSKLRKAELTALLNGIRHNVGDIVERAVDRKRGTVVEIQDSTFDGVNDSSVIVQYDGETREEATCGAHHAFVFISRPVQRKKMDRYGHWALSQPCVRGGSWDVRQGHADYCADWGHATYTVDGEVMSWCPRCGDPIKTPEEVISDLDTVDQTQAVDVMRQVVDNGREDLLPVLDKIDAAECKTPCGENSVIPFVSTCPRCWDSASRCDACVLAWLVDLFKITGDVKLNELPAAPEFDCV